MAAILAQVDGDAVRARQLAHPGGHDRVGIDGVALLAQGRDVIDVDEETNHEPSVASDSLRHARFG
jgi:hypothetical protein